MRIAAATTRRTKYGVPSTKYGVPSTKYGVLSPKFVVYAVFPNDMRRNCCLTEIRAFTSSRPIHDNKLRSRAFRFGQFDLQRRLRAITNLDPQGERMLASGQVALDALRALK